MSEQQDLSAKEKRLALHLRIWVGGALATAAFIIVNKIISGASYGVSEALFQGVMFLGVWVVLQYLIYRKAFKQFEE